ncbi:hypothetical protein HMPREF1863_01101 [Aedoeadaptatus coxii]|uniref:Uncharacterized protein n=1 Tax=Aedoeadaptatus coxii TaxID=755172 RepID=A0A134AF42_9FIRM|nr:hypothetical protein HMPREF1863_01101 [Peptoniphilus coxii]
MINLPAHAGVILVLGCNDLDDLKPTRTRGGDPHKERLTKFFGETYPHTRG